MRRPKRGFGLGLIAVAASLMLPAAPAASQAVDPPQLHSDQYLYGSAEADGLTRGTWHALVDYVADELKANEHHSLVDYVFNGFKPEDRHGVVLAKGSTLAHPSFVSCGDKPPAVVLDVDETAILNLGAEYDDLMAQRPYYDPDVWIRWEKTGYRDVVPTPGAKEALDKLRSMGVTVIFNTNRNAFDAAQTEAALNGAGLGPAKHGQTLFLQGDTPTGSGKDARREIIAGRYCVLAMAGDQLIDFSDHFDFDPQIWNLPLRRAAAEGAPIAALWGHGWFVMPNPVYGSALQGVADDIFPKDKQWRDPGAAAAASAPVPASAPSASTPATSGGLYVEGVLVILSAIAAAVAFVAGIVALRRTRLAAVFAGGTFAMTAFGALVVAIGWPGFDSGERVAFPLLVAAALLMCWAAWRAWRIAAFEEAPRSARYVAYVGFTLIAYLAGLLILLPLPAGFPWWLAALITLVFVGGAFAALSRYKRQLGAAPGAAAEGNA